MWLRFLRDELTEGVARDLRIDLYGIVDSLRGFVERARRLRHDRSHGLHTHHHPSAQR